MGAVYHSRIFAFRGISWNLPGAKSVGWLYRPIFCITFLTDFWNIDVKRGDRLDVEVFCDTTLWRLLNSYRSFVGVCCLLLQSLGKKHSLFFCINPKFLFTSLNDAISHTICIFINIALRDSNFVRHITVMWSAIVKSYVKSHC